MVQNKRLFREPPDYVICDGEMPGKQKEIVSQPESLQIAQTPEKAFPQHERIIGFVVNHMPDAAEFWILGKLLKLFNNIAVTQVHPAHDCTHKRVSIGQFQKPSGFFETLPGLHRDCPINACRTHQWEEVERQVIQPYSRSLYLQKCWCVSILMGVTLRPKSSAQEVVQDCNHHREESRNQTWISHTAEWCLG